MKVIPRSRVDLLVNLEDEDVVSADLVASLGEVAALSLPDGDDLDGPFIIPTFVIKPESMILVGFGVAQK